MRLGQDQDPAGGLEPGADGWDLDAGVLPLGRWLALALWSVPKGPGVAAGSLRLVGVGAGGLEPGAGCCGA